MLTGIFLQLACHYTLRLISAIGVQGEGLAFIDEMSVEDQKHYAEDSGKTEDEIAAITEPKRTLSFLSNGVLIPDLEAEEEIEIETP